MFVRLLYCTLSMCRKCCSFFQSHRSMETQIRGSSGLIRPCSRKLDHTDSLLVVPFSQAARTQKRLFENEPQPRPKELGESFTLTRTLQLGTQGRQHSLCQCGSVGKAEQSQTVTSAVTISGCEVLLPYFPPTASTSMHT